MTTYANVISMVGYAILLYGQAWGDVAEIKEIYDTMNFTDIYMP